jgi:hypothetical protein
MMPTSIKKNTKSLCDQLDPPAPPKKKTNHLDIQALTICSQPITILPHKFEEIRKIKIKTLFLLPIEF